ncbi:hypothetical protein OH77DRAFT_990308 [Trametes cingulata]|nr:hypothetical protein OH77DRAFT_990308 [Trametes cingulata]
MRHRCHHEYELGIGSGDYGYAAIVDECEPLQEHGPPPPGSYSFPTASPPPPSAKWITKICPLSHAIHQLQDTARPESVSMRMSSTGSSMGTGEAMVKKASIAAGCEADARMGRCRAASCEAWDAERSMDARNELESTQAHRQERREALTIRLACLISRSVCAYPTAGRQ